MVWRKVLLRLRVSNNIGQQVAIKKIAVESNSQIELVSLPALPPVYILYNLPATALSLTQKIVIQ